jgi:hypothetical protein
MFCEQDDLNPLLKQHAKKYLIDEGIDRSSALKVGFSGETIPNDIAGQFVVRKDEAAAALCHRSILEIFMAI